MNPNKKKVTLLIFRSNSDVLGYKTQLQAQTLNKPSPADNPI